MPKNLKKKISFSCRQPKTDFTFLFYTSKNNYRKKNFFLCTFTGPLPKNIDLLSHHDF